MRPLFLLLFVALAPSVASLLAGSACIQRESSSERRGVARARHLRNPGHKGRKTILHRREAQEITTAEDLFNVGPVTDQAAYKKKGDTTMSRPIQLSDEEFPALDSTLSSDAPAGNVVDTVRPGRGSTARATWGEPVMVGLSGGGGKMPDVAHPKADAWPSDIRLSELLHAAPGGWLPLRGCSWNPKERNWDLVETSVAEEGDHDNRQLSIRVMKRSDITAMKPINFACPLTEQFPRFYYEKYMNTWPDLCLAMECGPDGELAGYVLAKVETGPEGLYGHVSALTVKRECRRRGVARRLMAQVELICAQKYSALYVDLFVKTSNVKAQNFYQKMGYATFRVIKGYYDDGDALDMRKSLPADRQNRRMRPRGPGAAP